MTDKIKDKKKKYPILMFLMCWKKKGTELIFYQLLLKEKLLFIETFGRDRNESEPGVFADKLDRFALRVKNIFYWNVRLHWRQVRVSREGEPPFRVRIIRKNCLKYLPNFLSEDWAPYLKNSLDWHDLVRVAFILRIFEFRWTHPLIIL